MCSLALTNVCGHSTAGSGTLWAMRSPLLWMPPACLWVFILFLAVQSTAYGQSSTYARLVGTVKDQTGAVVPGAEVTATARATNISRQAISDDRGEYILDKLIPGLYDVRAELPASRGTGERTSVWRSLR